jgi:PAS domain S-box-containing protein
LIENSGSIIYVKDLEGKYKLVNSKWEQVTGINREQAIASNDDDIFPAKLAIQFIQNDANVIKNNAHTISEETVFNLNGNHHFISNNYPLKDENDYVIGVCNFSTDITELVSTREALNKKSIQFDALVSKLPVGVYVIQSKPNGMFSFVYVSSPMSKIVGLPLEEILKDAMGTFNKVHPLDFDGFMNANLEAFNNQAPFKYTARIMVGKEIRHCKFESFPDKLENGDTLWNGMVTDITEQKMAKEELALANTNLKKSIIEKDRFFSILAHDLRGPINGILALIEMVSEDFDEIDRDELRNMISGMNSSATNVKRLLDNLLEWAGMQQGKINYQPASINVAKAIENAVNLTMNQAMLKGQEIAFENNPLHQVLADPHMLDSTLRNLISNAMKFTPKGGKIIISSKERDDNKLQISIKDNGIGMDKAILQKLFLVDEKTNRIGTEGEPSAGLGLILCKDFVLKNRGEIWAESQVNIGSTFHFTLPIS